MPAISPEEMIMQADQMNIRLEIVRGIPIEIISEGYEQKDLEIAPDFYLAMGIKDVLIVDPQLRQVYHHRRDGKKRLALPVRLELECGCGCEV
jgi:Uma2 family endonuclease